MEDDLFLHISFVFRCSRLRQSVLGWKNSKSAHSIQEICFVEVLIFALGFVSIGILMDGEFFSLSPLS